jgi:hypothetical protein
LIKPSPNLTTTGGIAIKNVGRAQVASSSAAGMGPGKTPVGKVNDEFANGFRQKYRENQKKLDVLYEHLKGSRDIWIGLNGVRRDLRERRDKLMEKIEAIDVDVARAMFGQIDAMNRRVDELIDRANALDSRVFEQMDRTEQMIDELRPRVFERWWHEFIDRDRRNTYRKLRSPNATTGVTG